jgi:hypothetical protein
MSAVHLAQMQRLAALMKQAHHDVRNLASVQRRINAILLATGDLTLSQEVLDELDEMLAGAAQAITVMQEHLLSAREGSDSGIGTNEEDCQQ